jgi:hypothetical protein
MYSDQLIKQNDFILWLALKHHITHKKTRLDFKNHAYQKAIYVDKSPYIVIKKSTQCGLTEFLIVRSIGKAISGQSIFYVLPTYQLVNRFVRNRVDKTINNTAYYKGLEQLAKEQDSYKRSESMTLKDIGNGTIAYTGSNSTASFTEFPADDIIIDELDECDQKNIIMAWERMSHSEYRTQIKIANPTIEGYGIDKEFVETNQMEWHIKHDCGKYITFDWFQQVVEEIDNGLYRIRDQEWDWNCDRDIGMICQYCGKMINRRQDGIWVPKNNDEKKRGYHISKLFSSTVSIMEIMDRFMKGLKNDTVLQRFHNADLGQAFTAKGAKITREMLNNCLGNYRNESKFEGIGLAGIDVGNVLNIIIGYLFPDGIIRISQIIEFQTDFDELLSLLKEYGIRVVVIDAHPEKDFVRRLKNSYKNVFSCIYADAKKEPVDESHNLTVDRTASLDQVKEGLLSKTFMFPINAESIPNFYSQMTSSTRVFDQKRNKGSGAYVWIESSPDHYFHAMNYINQAKRLIAAVMK